MPVWGFLLASVLVLASPVILTLVIRRRTINRHLGRAALTISFAIATAYVSWHLEWFDVWRHGVPPPTSLAIYVSYAAAFGALGWFIGGRILPRQRVRPS